MDDTPLRLPAVVQRLRILRIIWVALMASVVINVTIAGYLATFVTLDLTGDMARFTVTGLAVLAIAAAGLSLWLRARHLRALAGAGGGVNAVLSRFGLAHIICWAIDEAIAALGLFATLITAEPVVGVVFGLVALGLMGIVQRPSTAALADALRAARQHAS